MKDSPQSKGVPLKNDANEKRRICHPGKESDKIELDHEFEKLIPSLSSSELFDLQNSLDAEGCRDALIVWKGHDILVDGHNRIRHCRAKSYPFPVIEKEFADREEVKTYIIHCQLGRRNLSPGAESYLRGMRYLEVKKQGVRTDLTSGQSDQKSSSERLAKEFSVGEKTIRRDGKFAEAVDQIAENCGSGTRDLLLSRVTDLTRGNILRLSKLKPEEQAAFVKELKSSGVKPRKPRKKGRAKNTITVPVQPKALVDSLLRELKPEAVSEIAKALMAALEKNEGKESQKTGKVKAKQ